VNLFALMICPLVEFKPSVLKLAGLDAGFGALYGSTKRLHTGYWAAA